MPDPWDLEATSRLIGPSRRLAPRAGNIRPVLAALNVGAVGLGVAAGGLSASVIGFGLSWLLTILGVDSGPDLGLIIGVFAGLAAGGWIAGLRAKHSERFHGAVTGLVLAFIIMLIAVLGGSPAPTSSILLLALISIFIAGLSGWLAGRRKRTAP